MRIQLINQQPSALPAARLRNAHDVLVGRCAFVALAGPAAGDYGIGVSAVDGGGALPVAHSFTAAASGVPPRGRPV